jgi:hypothetical protein
MKEIEIKQTIEDVVLHKQALAVRLAIAVEEVRECQKQLERYRADLNTNTLARVCSKFGTENILDAVQISVDREVWTYLVQRTRVGQFMTLEQRAAFEKMTDRSKSVVDSWDEVSFVPLTVNNAHATLLNACASAAENTEQAVVGLFQSLSVHHKSNTGFSFGSRLIYTGVLGRFDLIHEDVAEKLFELQRVVDIMEGRLPAESAWLSPLVIAVRAGFSRKALVGETDQIEYKLFKNRNAHFHIKNPDTIKAMNAIVAKRLGGNILGQNGKPK